MYSNVVFNMTFQEEFRENILCSFTPCYTASLAPYFHQDFELQVLLDLVQRKIYIDEFHV